MKFFQTAAAVLAANIAALITILIVNVVISRTLGAEGKGLVSLYHNIAEVLYIVGSLGLATAVQYFVSRKEGDVRVHFGHLLYVPLIAAVLLSLVFVATYNWWRPFLQDLPLSQVYPALLVLPAMMAFECLAQFLVAIGRVGERSIAVFVRGVAALLLVLIVLSLPGATAITVMWTFMFAWGCAAGLALYYSLRAVGPPRRPELGLLRQTWRYGVWIHITNVARHAFQKVDFLLVFAMLDSASAGVYSVASGLTSALLMIPLAVQTVFFPKTAAQSQADAETTTALYFRQMAIFMLAGAIASAALARPVLSLFGREFLAAQWPFVVLLIGAIIKGMNGIVSTHLLGRGFARLITFVTFVTFMSAIVFNYVLIGSYGLIGAAVATSSAYALQLLVLITFYAVKSRGSIGALFRFRPRDVKIALESSLKFARLVLKRKSG